MKRKEGEEDGHARVPVTTLERPSKAWGYPRRSERPVGKERRRPSMPWPQFVWLSRYGSADETETDGSPYRELCQCQLQAALYREWKEQAPELRLFTLYYVADNIDDPAKGRDLAVLHHRVDKHSCESGFHSHVEVLNPTDHSRRLIELVRERRERNLRQEVPPAATDGTDGFGDLESFSNYADDGASGEDGDAAKYEDKAPQDEETIEYLPREVTWWAPP